MRLQNPRPGRVGLVVLLAVTPPLALLALTSLAAPPGAHDRDWADQVVPGLSGYKRWACANETPRQMPPGVEGLCAVWPQEPPLGRPGDPPLGTPGLPTRGPHFRRYARVYVNDKGRAAFFWQRDPRFPVGTVIVKEKLETLTSKAPEILTVMVKREPGYDRAAGDWEYVVLDGARQVQASGKLAHCRACHVEKASTGYVFRDYLSKTAAAKLR